MSLRMDYMYDQPRYSNNTLVGRTEWGAYFFSITVTERGASLNRYCVPGRIDTYTFDWVPGSTGVGDRVAFFTDTGISLMSAMKLLKKDLKRKEVKLMLKEVDLKLRRHYLANLLEALR